MESKKANSGIREFFTVVGIAVVVAGAMTLLALVPPVSILHRWLTERGDYLWTALVAGIVGGVLSFYRSKQREKQE